MMHKCLGQSVANTDPPPPELVEELSDTNQDHANENISGANDDILGANDDISGAKHDLSDTNQVANELSEAAMEKSREEGNGHEGRNIVVSGGPNIFIENAGNTVNLSF